MIDHQIARQAREHRLVVRQLAPIELKLHVPAERRNPRRHGLQNVPGQRAAGEHEEADAADAETGQPVKLGIGDRLIHDRDPARAGAKRFHRLDRAAIVGAVCGGLHDHDALDAEPFAHLQIVGNGCIRRIDARGRRLWIAAVVYMHVGVAGARRRLELRPCGIVRFHECASCSCVVFQRMCLHRVRNFRVLTIIMPKWKLSESGRRSSADRDHQQPKQNHGSRRSDHQQGQDHCRRHHGRGNFRCCRHCPCSGGQALSLRSRSANPVRLQRGIRSFLRKTQGAEQGDDARRAVSRGAIGSGAANPATGQIRRH